MSTYPGNQSGGMGGKSMGGPNTAGPGGYGNNYDGNPNQGGMPTQFAAGGPGMGVGKGIGMDYRNLGGNPGMGSPQPGDRDYAFSGPGYYGPMPESGNLQPPGLPSTGMPGGKSGGPIGGLVNQIPGMAGGMLNNLFPGINQTPGFNQGINQAPGQMFPGLGGGGQPQPDFGLPPGMEEMPMIDPSQLRGGGQLVGGAYGKPIFGGGMTPEQRDTQFLVGAGPGVDPILGGGSIQNMMDPIQSGFVPGFGGDIGMPSPANRFAPPNAPGVRTARQPQPVPAPARVPAARVSNTNVQTPARVAPRSAPKPITRTRSR